ncbi:MAG: GGDEF domain-containing protein [Nanoarchaeota archaeon]|nr:GGDEF domain-containing protein [Nanoarchaeota archaeon]
MDIEKLKTLALKLQGEILISGEYALGGDRIITDKVIDIHEHAKELLPAYKTLFDKLLKTLRESSLGIKMKTAADLCKDIYEYATLEENKDSNIETEKFDNLTGLLEGNKLNEIDFTKYKKISIAFLDVDNFKKINDNYMHDKGDLALKQVSSMLKELEKKGCWVLRNHGARGDEFIVILPDFGKKASFELLDEYRERIEKGKIENLFNVTVSVGIATYPDDADKKEDIIKKADEALYFSKENGRNQTTMYNEGLKEEIKIIQFRLEEIANIKNGSKVIVKSWRCHNAPDIYNLEAVEIVDLNEDIEYTSRNKGTTMTVIIIKKEIRGIVKEVKRPPGSTLFKLAVQKSQLEGISSDPREFLHPLVR